MCNNYFISKRLTILDMRILLIVSKVKNNMICIFLLWFLWYILRSIQVLRWISDCLKFEVLKIDFVQVHKIFSFRLIFFVMDWLLTTADCGSHWTMNVPCMQWFPKVFFKAFFSRDPMDASNTCSVKNEMKCQFWFQHHSAASVMTMAQFDSYLI